MRGSLESGLGGLGVQQSVCRAVPQPGSCPGPQEAQGKLDQRAVNRPVKSRATAPGQHVEGRGRARAWPGQGCGGPERQSEAHAARTSARREGRPRDPEAPTPQGPGPAEKPPSDGRRHSGQRPRSPFPERSVLGGYACPAPRRAPRPQLRGGSGCLDKVAGGGGGHTREAVPGLAGGSGQSSGARGGRGLSWDTGPTPEQDPGGTVLVTAVMALGSTGNAKATP